jgi:hypothetical protein
MAGYGNRTAPDYVADNMTDEHGSTRLGLHTSRDAYSDAHPKYGSGATGGAGFGMHFIFLLAHIAGPQVTLLTISNPYFEINFTRA